MHARAPGTWRLSPLPRIPPATYLLHPFCLSPGAGTIGKRLLLSRLLTHLSSPPVLRLKHQPHRQVRRPLICDAGPVPPALSVLIPTVSVGPSFCHSVSPRPLLPSSLSPPCPLPDRGPCRPTSLAGRRPGRATNSSHQMGPVLGNAQKSLEQNRSLEARRVTCVSVLPPEEITILRGQTPCVMVPAGQQVGPRP